MRIKITRENSLLTVVLDREVSERVADIVIQTIEDHTASPDAGSTGGECTYECPFTEEGHQAHDVDHEFVA